MGLFRKKVFTVLISLVLCTGLLSGCAGQGDRSADSASGSQNSGVSGDPSGNRSGNEAGNNASSSNTAPGSDVPAKNNVTVQWREGLKVSYVLPEGLKGPDELSPSEKEFFFGYDEAVCAYTFSDAEENLLIFHIGSERDLEGLTAEQKIAQAERSGFLVTDETVDVRREKLENANGCEVWKCIYVCEFGGAGDQGHGNLASPRNNSDSALQQYAGDVAHEQELRNESSEDVPDHWTFTDYRYFVDCGEFFCSFGVLGSGQGPAKRDGSLGDRDPGISENRNLVARDNGASKRSSLVDLSTSSPVDRTSGIIGEQLNGNIVEQYSEKIAELFKSMSIDSSALSFAYDPQNDNSEETSFFYGLMDEEERAIYKEIEAALDVRKLKDGQDMEYHRAFESEEEMNRYWRILECVEFEHPENIFSPSAWEHEGKEIDVLYRCAADNYNGGNVSERLDLLKRIEDTADRIIAGMPKNLTRYGKYMYLARAMNELVKYDYDDLDVSVVKDDLGYPSSLIGVYIYGKAVCEGYAQGYAYLCKRAGLFCTELIAGDHAWNLIRLGGDLYHFDPTWMDEGDRSWLHPNNYKDLDQDHKTYLEHVQFRNSGWQPSIDAAKKTGPISWSGEQ